LVIIKIIIAKNNGDAEAPPLRMLFIYLPEFTKVIRHKEQGAKMQSV